MLQKYKKKYELHNKSTKKIYFLFLTKIYIPHFQPNKKYSLNKNKINIRFILLYISFVVTLHPVNKMLTKGCYRSCGC